MVLDRKQFDDFDDDFGDFDEKLDPTADLDSPGGGIRVNSSLSWRRAIIERAAINVRKAVEQKTDIQSSYKGGTLVFDDAANKFGRVLESRPGFLNISLLTGGKIVKQDLDQLDFIRKNRQKLTLPQMSQELRLSEVEVISLLNQIELELEAHKPVKEKEVIRKVVQAGATKVAIKAVTVKKPELKVISKEKPKPTVSKKISKPSIKLAAKPAKHKAKKVTATKGVNESFTKLLPKGVSTDPVVDPNGYIKQNFLLMSNKELARATSLSEHTVRRKLGEWGLKRKETSSKK